MLFGKTPSNSAVGGITIWLSALSGCRQNRQLI